MTEGGRLPAPLFLSSFFSLLMISIAATSLAVFFHCLGFVIGCAIWCCIGYGIGSAIDAPISGTLTGLAWQTGCYFVTHEQMSASLDRTRQKFLAVLERSFA